MAEPVHQTTVDVIAEQLHYRMGQMDPDNVDTWNWDEADESEKEFARECVREVLRVRSRVMLALEELKRDA